MFSIRLKNSLEIPAYIAPRENELRLIFQLTSALNFPGGKKAGYKRGRRRLKFLIINDCHVISTLVNYRVYKNLRNSMQLFLKNSIRKYEITLNKKKKKRNETDLMTRKQKLEEDR